jgi:hypothetical protein
MPSAISRARSLRCSGEVHGIYPVALSDRMQNRLKLLLRSAFGLPILDDVDPERLGYAVAQFSNGSIRIASRWLKI